MSNPEKLVAQFIEVSGEDENTAKLYLANANWSLQEALLNLLGTNSRNTIPSPTTSKIKSKITETTPSSNDDQNGTHLYTNITCKARLVTLSDINEHSSNEAESQTFYAGGSERSGQQIIGPGRSNSQENLSDVFRMAYSQKHFSNSVDSSELQWGQGVPLDVKESHHSTINAANNKQYEKKTPVTLKLWSQGFTVNDGEFRPYEESNNKEFLKTVMKGEIPTELLEMGWMVNVDVEDHRHEVYQNTKSNSFEGPGHTLGCPAPIIEPETNIRDSNEHHFQSSESNENEDKSPNDFDASFPSTTLQIRLADGTRLFVQFNLSHTIGDIQEFITVVRPQYAQVDFVLQTSFPTREICDLSSTIEAAAIQNAVLIQRLI